MIVSVHSFRGGTGKSNVTANVAAMVAKTGKRVGIIDTDIQSPGIHVLFGLDEEQIANTLNNYLWGQCPIEDAAYKLGQKVGEKGSVVVMNGDMYLVPSSIKASEIARVLREGYDVELLQKGFQEVIRRLKLDYLFIDTHPGLNEETLLSIAMSDVLIVILRPDQQDYLGTAVTVDVARKLDVPNLYMVVNKALDSFDLNEIRAKVQQAYNAPVIGVLPLSEDIVRLGSRGVFSLMNPDHPWSKTIQQIARRVMEGG